MAYFAAIATALLLARSAYGQGTSAPSTDRNLEFEVASVKAAPSPDGHGMRVGMRGGPGTSDPTLITIENMTMFGLVRRAYDLKDYQIAHPDSLLDSPRYNIAARIPAGATKDDLLRMLQGLLGERFKLRFHHETRQVQIYRLVVGKNEPNLKESTGEPTPDETAGRPKFDKDGYPIMAPGTMGITSLNGVARARANAASESMMELAAMLATQLDRPVIDATGLKGRYDFVLSWFPEHLNAAAPSAADAPSGSAQAARTPYEGGPSLMAAIEQQLGLKLESAKGPVDMFVVDHFERVPAEN